MKVYGYKNCGTCKKAEKWLKARDIAYESIPIVDKPPSHAVLKKALKTGRYELKHLFNTSGGQYRELDMKSKLPTMTQAEALKLLAGNGMLCKRPIIVDGEKVTVGFKEAVFEEVWG